MTAVPAAGVVAEAMVALELAAAATEKFGGDSVAETARNARGYTARAGDLMSGARGDPDRPARGREVDRRPACWRSAWASRFLDTDAGIEAEAGKPVSDIFVEDGEDAFRALERTAVARAVAGHPGVLGLGGGAVLDAGTQELLAGQPVVYLETSFAAAVKRVGLDTARPLLLGNPRAQLKTLLDQRLPVYERLAWLTVRTDDRSPEDIAGEIARRVADDDGAGAGASPGPPR